MANWIKWEKGVWRKPEIWSTARLLQVTPAQAVLYWFRVWEWADDLTIDGWIAGITRADVDDIAGKIGFAAAGEDVHWLKFEDDGLFLANFDRHNGKSAKRRAVNAERQRLYRDAGHA